MRTDEQQHIVDVLEEHRQRLIALCAKVRGQRETAEELEAVASRILDVQNALLADVRHRRRRSLSLRLQQWTSPRLGLLRHHPPQPLTVPSSYLRVDPPQPPPRISIVTPSFQQGRYLERTILSVLEQGYPALEYVIEDGGSTDGTLEVIQRYERCLSRWRSGPDGGQADAINRGFESTSGEIMAYLNSDDLLLPGALAYVARYFVKHPAVDALYGHRVLIDEHDRQIGSWVLPRHNDAVLSVADYVPQETLFWRRRAWERAGGAMDPSFQSALDWEFLLRLRLAGAQLVRVPRFLGAFRVHDEQKTSALSSVGMAEANRLRRQALGRELSPEEVAARTKPFLRGHVLYHTLHRLGARAPRSRTRVRTRPLEPGVRADSQAQAQADRIA